MTARRTRRRRVAAVALVTGVAAAVLVVAGRFPATAPGRPFEDVAGGCAAAVGPAGFATVAVDGLVEIRGRAAQVTTPCRLELRPGARLVIDHADLRTGPLWIGDGGAGSESSVTIAESRLVGDGGLHVAFSDADDVVAISSSQLDYRSGIGVTVDGDAGPTAHPNLELSAVTLRSRGAGSLGVVAAVNGRASLRNVTVDTDGSYAYVLAGSCEMVDVRGIPPRCYP